MKLSAALREVARRYDEDWHTHNWTTFCNALCFAVSDVMEGHFNTGNAYRKVQTALLQIHGDSCLGRYPGSRKGWESRIWMCLLMAEWLEEEGR
jgi:hypothetical protein